MASGAASTLAEPDRAVLGVLAGPLLPEAVASRAAISVPEAVATLMRLELKGLVRSVGGRFEPTVAAARALQLTGGGGIATG
jgi:predicted Rossmann fold nucleotide-binding protein DprA/Smf involved in DNA uptake